MLSTTRADCVKKWVGLTEAYTWMAQRSPLADRALELCRELLTTVGLAVGSLSPKEEPRISAGVTMP